MTDIRTMNLGDAGDGMVPLDTKPKLEQPSTSFVDENLIEKNVSQQQETTMDSTPIADLMAPQAGAGPNFMATPGHGSGRSQPRRFAVYVRSSDRCWVCSGNRRVLSKEKIQEIVE